MSSPGQHVPNNGMFAVMYQQLSCSLILSLVVSAHIILKLIGGQNNLRLTGTVFVLALANRVFGDPHPRLVPQRCPKPTTPLHDHL